MKFKRLIILASLCLPMGAVQAQADDNDDFGVWTEISVKKELTQTLDLGFEGEIRTGNNSSTIDRLSGGIALSYKPSKYFKFGASYIFYGDYSAEKESKHAYFEDGELASYRLTPGYWKPNHRFYVEGTATKKFWKWLRISVRERYQFNHEAETSIDRTEFEREEYFTPNGVERGDWESYNVPKINECQSQQRLRTRVKLEYDKKGVNWSPFVSVELYNGINDKMHLQKIRTGVGTEYKINKQHKVGMAYLYSCHLNEAPNEHKHALNISYGFDF